MALLNTQHADYKARWATRADFSKIVSMFKPVYIDETGTAITRPKTVFERTPEAFADAIQDDRALVLTDAKGAIKAFGGIQLLQASTPIAKAIDASGEFSSSVDTTFTVAEIGSIYRPGSEPSGFCLELIYDLLVLQALEKARESMIGLLVTQIVANNQAGVERLIELQQGWELCTIQAAYKDEFNQTIPDQESRETTLVTYHAPPAKSVLAAAKSLVGVEADNTFSVVNMERGIIAAEDRNSQRRVTIDVDETGLLGRANDIVFNSSSHNANQVARLSWQQLNRHIVGRHPQSSVERKSLKKPGRRLSGDAAAYG